MLQPKRTKYRKMHRNRGGNSGVAQSGHRIAFGDYGIKALTAGELNSREIESARRVVSRRLNRVGNVWIRVFPHLAITRKAAEVPMGSGKGSVDFYVARVKPGTVLFEIGGCDEELARDAIRLAGHKLSVLTKFISKFDS